MGSSSDLSAIAPVDAGQPIGARRVDPAHEARGVWQADAVDRAVEPGLEQLQALACDRRALLGRYRRCGEHYGRHRDDVSERTHADHLFCDART